MIRTPSHSSSLTRIGAALALCVAAAVPAVAHASEAAGAVFVLSNQAVDNAVLVYARAADGSLTYTGSVPTGGSGGGTGGDPLASQGALTLGSGFLFAVNAGSNELSLFSVHGSTLTLVDKQSSGGTMPVSVAVSGFHVYVLNAGGTPNISGFDLDPVRGALIPLQNSARPLVGGVAAKPAEVAFTEDGEGLLVTEKGTQTIDSYTLDDQGYASQPVAHPASGAVPFGFKVNASDVAFVVEASGSVSSYRVGEEGRFSTITASLPLGQKAPCWLATTGDGRYVFTANAGSGTISSLTVGHGGQLSLLNPVAGTLAAPLDMALSAGSQFLYARDGNGAVTGFRIGSDGSLTQVASVSNIPAGAQGIAAR